MSAAEHCHEKSTNKQRQRTSKPPLRSGFGPLLWALSNIMSSTPEIRKLVKLELIDLGFKNPSHDGSALFLYRELSENRISLQFSINDFSNGKMISFKSSFVSNRIGNAINYITQEKHTAWPESKLNSKTWEWASIEKCDVKKLTLTIANEAIEFASNSSFNPMLNDMLSTIERRGSHQIWYIAGLASIGDQDKLKELDNALLREDRGGLFPFIKKIHISRALEYVAENA
ncbi:MAG: hypothetical protein R3254_11535 [Thiomicrorhabdus sp.]|nr:hypothetical protein [Thiomicrorhabdus sp.]